MRPDGALRGPFNAFLLSPRLGDALQNLGAAIRYRTALPPRVREMAILTVAAHWDSPFEQSAHEHVGRACGVTEEEMAAIREGRVPDLADPYERACAHLARLMVADGDVDDESWDSWADQAGNITVFELSTLVGYYAMIALQMRVFRVH
ncbi:carboxymuconolactone decarboxylase family protein [Thermocatellispora tengchongensis]|uniref:carboxymuconolactone decarboxylase family protein n=1 Tax=Thermocatellispora tengchongensis TaxID=1073253 RepID=UPI003634CE44